LVILTLKSICENVNVHIMGLNATQSGVSVMVQHKF